MPTEDNKSAKGARHRNPPTRVQDSDLQTVNLSDVNTELTICATFNIK